MRDRHFLHALQSYKNCATDQSSASGQDGRSFTFPSHGVNCTSTQHSPPSILPLKGLSSKTLPASTANMRLPGTINIVNNELPTPKFLAHYKALKQKQKAAAGDITNELKAGTLPGKIRDDKNGTTNAEATKSGSDDAAKHDGDFNAVQDALLIELKLKDTSWKDIAAELGKEEGQIRTRFREIKPADFDARHKAALEKKKMEKQGKQGKKNKNNGGGGEGKDNAEQGKDDKIKIDNSNKKNDEVKQEPEAVVVVADWWEQPDDNWSKEEVSNIFMHVHSLG